MAQMQLDLPGRVLVSGAAGGIGGAIAAKLAAAGVDVIGTDLRPVPQDWQGGQWIEADLATDAGRTALIEAIDDKIDGVVMAAGMLDPADWQRLDVAGAETLLRVNLLAPFFLVRALADRMNAGGAVVLMGSIAGARAAPATPLYAASKAALRNLGASLALLLQERAIRVNVAAPGLIDTPLTSGLNAELAERRGVSVETVVAERALPIPMGRAGTSEEVADTCLFLLSRQASYLTGSTLYATGGVLAGSI